MRHISRYKLFFIDHLIRSLECSFKGRNALFCRETQTDESDIEGDAEASESQGLTSQDQLKALKSELRPRDTKDIAKDARAGKQQTRNSCCVTRS